MAEFTPPVLITLQETTDNMNYWVDPSGSDSNNGSISSPFKTINHALNMVPKIVKHQIGIKVNAGTYNEDVSINGFITLPVSENIARGILYVRQTNDDNTAVSIKSIRVHGCRGHFRIWYLTATGDDGDASFSVHNSGPWIYFYNCVTTAADATKDGFYFSWGSGGYMNNCTASNRRYGIYSSNASVVFSAVNSGTGNTVGLRADLGGRIIKYDIFQPIGTTREQYGTSGLIEFGEKTFTANSFHFPNPGTDWTPIVQGAYLGASLATKKCWIPLNFLKQGDIIVSYKLVGDAIETTALTLDCKLVTVNKADPITTTDVANGAIAQVTADGNFDVEAAPAGLTGLATVATDKQYLLEILGTTGVADEIYVMGAEVKLYRR